MHKLKEDGAHRPLFDVRTKQQSTRFKYDLLANPPQ